MNTSNVGLQVWLKDEAIRPANQTSVIADIGDDPLKHGFQYQNDDRAKPPLHQSSPILDGAQ